MVLPLVVGAGMIAAGTGAQLLGQSQRDRATKNALRQYRDALAGREASQRDAMDQEQGVLSGFARERQNGIGNYISEMGQAENPGTDEGFAANQKGVLNDIGKLTGGPQSSFAYAGAPQAASQAQQDTRTGVDSLRMAEALLADHTKQLIANRQQSANTRMSLADAMRGGKIKNAQQRMQLAKALRDLDWQHKTAALQGTLDAAGRKGQWLSMLGGLGSQAGGLAMMAPGGAGGEAGPGTMSPQDTNIAQEPQGGWLSNGMA